MLKNIQKEKRIRYSLISAFIYSIGVFVIRITIDFLNGKSLSLSTIFSNSYLLMIVLLFVFWVPVAYFLIWPQKNRKIIDQ